MSLHTYGGSIEIPEPLIQVRTEEAWKHGGFTGFREYTTTISVGEVVLLERTANDEEDFRVNADAHQEKTVNEFAERLKAVLGL